MHCTTVRIRSAIVCLGLALVVALSVSAPASAQAAQGTVSIEAFTLSGTQFGTPSGRPTLVATDPLALPITDGEDFRYSSIECSSPQARFNNVGLDFTPDFPGLDDPASIRSVIEGEVTSVSNSGNRGTVEGTVTSFLCVNGEETDVIVAAFESEFRRTGNTMLQLRGGDVRTTGGLKLTGGTFEIVSGTGRFDSLTGAGTLTGQFTCLPSTLDRNDAKRCTDLGAFSEAIFQLQGSYLDPAPGPASGS